ncbi:hypothetical protein [Flavisolibacter tropicus]|uniref:Uncharacterized protein n=1 Tax=Flavisolibacter tropicus TaxID=1492898 RepID=A0A172U0I7_9BACT|nr:hypothetical protein [Flavisolibacter tropicus]ANE52543.1 hypothetical protein SY85_20740 [Flavisolibacter tropicus]
MAKQTNQYYIGRQGNLLYYQWRDVFCIRTKGTLDKKRFYEDKAFEGSRKRAVEFGEASKLAAKIYEQLPAVLKVRGFIGRVTGLVHRKLMAGKSRETVMLELLMEYGVITKAMFERLGGKERINSQHSTLSRYGINENINFYFWWVNDSGVLQQQCTKALEPPSG